MEAIKVWYWEHAPNSIKMLNHNGQAKYSYIIQVPRMDKTKMKFWLVPPLCYDTDPEYVEVLNYTYFFTN